MRLVEFVNQFKNRHKEEYHFALLSVLKEQGPVPPTILAYRAELNDTQAQETVEYLAEYKLVTVQELTDKLRSKLNLPWGYSSKNIITITEKGLKYLELLSVLLQQINWKVAKETNQKRKRAINAKVKISK